jgi:hypothetical protein
MTYCRNADANQRITARRSTASRSAIVPPSAREPVSVEPNWRTISPHARAITSS